MRRGARGQAFEIGEQGRFLQVDLAQLVERESPEITRRGKRVAAPDIGWMRTRIGGLRRGRREAVECVCDAGKRIGHACACYCYVSFWQVGNQAPSVFNAATAESRSSKAGSASAALICATASGLRPRSA